MVWVGCLEKFLEVIRRLLHLALEITLGRGNMFLIRVISLLVVFIFVAASVNCDPSGVPLLPPLIAFGTPLSTFIDSLGWYPSTASEDYLSIALDKNGPNYLFSRGMVSGYVKQLHCGLQFMAKLMHKGLAASARPEC
jgi:hypothetical protein